MHTKQQTKIYKQTASTQSVLVLHNDCNSRILNPKILVMFANLKSWN